MKLTAGLLLALLSTAALNYGFYLQHAASGALPSLTLRHPGASLRALFTNLKWAAGFVIGISGWALYIIALGLAPLSLVQATSAGGVGLLALLVRAGGTRLSRQEWAAVAASAGGLLMLGLSLSAGAAHAVPGSWGPPLAWVLVSMVLAAAAASPAAAILRPGSGLAVAAGLLYSAGDVVTKAAVGGTNPVIMFALLLPACHGLAFISLQLSFQRGTTLATAGVSTLLTNLLPILAGLTVFAEHLPGGVPGILRGLGFTSAVLGAAMLARRGPPGHDDSGRPGKRHRRQARATFQGNELSPDPSDVSAGTGHVRAGARPSLAVGACSSQAGSHGYLISRCSVPGAGRRDASGRAR